MKWALVLWLANPNNFTVLDRFQTVEDCLEKRETVISAFSQANSQMKAVCRPIRADGDKARSNIVVHKAVIY